MITADEYQERVTRLRKRLQTHEYDVYVASTPDTIYYLTGAAFSADERPVLLLIWANRQSEIIAPIEKVHIGGQIPWALLSVYREYPAVPSQDWKGRLADVLGSIDRVALEPYTRVELADQVGSRGYIERFVEDLRTIKSPAELRQIGRASYYADRIVQLMRAAAVSGSTVAHVYECAASAAGESMRELGSRYTPFLTNSMPVPWPAPMNAEPHRLPNMTDVFAEGPHNLTSISRFDGYSAECERVHWTTAPDKSGLKAHRAVVEARRRAFAMLKPGQRTSEIDSEVNSYLCNEGYGDYLLYRTGHGFGLGGHERPWIAQGSDDTLEANMVVSVEPGMYIPGVGGLRDSDTVLITQSGYEVLTKEPYYPL